MSGHKPAEPNQKHLRDLTGGPDVDRNTQILRQLEAMLDGRFFRAGRSLLINLSCIRRIARSEVELLDGEILPLPRGAYEPLNRAFIEYF